MLLIHKLIQYRFILNWSYPVQKNAHSNLGVAAIYGHRFFLIENSSACSNPNYYGIWQNTGGDTSFPEFRTATLLTEPIFLSHSL